MGFDTCYLYSMEALWHPLNYRISVEFSRREFSNGAVVQYQLVRSRERKKRMMRNDSRCMWNLSSLVVKGFFK